MSPHPMPPWEGFNPSKERRGNDQNKQAHWGPMTSDTCAKPPTYGSHPCQCIVQPINDNTHATLCPKSKPKTQRMPPKGY